MKKCIVGLMLFVFLQGIVMAETLSRVEALSEAEVEELNKIENTISQLYLQLQETKEKIAKNHKMQKESYMEYSKWFEIKDTYILYYYQSHMTPDELRRSALEQHMEKVSSEFNKLRNKE